MVGHVCPTPVEAKPGEKFKCACGKLYVAAIEFDNDGSAFHWLEVKWT